MTKKTGHVGHDSGGHKSSRWLSPQKPYTGDGKTKRSFIDGAIKVVFKPGPKKKPEKD